MQLSHGRTREIIRRAIGESSSRRESLRGAVGTTSQWNQIAPAKQTRDETELKLSHLLVFVSIDVIECIKYPRGRQSGKLMIRPLCVPCALRVIGGVHFAARAPIPRTAQSHRNRLCRVAASAAHPRHPATESGRPTGPARVAIVE